MSKQRTTRLSAMTWWITTFAIVFNLIAPAFDMIAAQAQAEPTPEPTAEPVAAEPTAEAPVEPTAQPTVEAPTALPTAAPTEPTALPTLEATPEPSATPVLVGDFADDFQDGAAEGWSLTPGWTVTLDGVENYVLAASATNTNEVATLPGVVFQNFSLGVKTQVSAGSVLNLSLRAGAESYLVTLDADGYTSLYRGPALLGSTVPTAEGTPEADATAEAPSPAVWRTLNVQANGAQILVAVDGIVQISHEDPAPIIEGTLVFSTVAANAGSVALDDLTITRLPDTFAPPTQAAPEVTVEPTEQPTQDVVVDTPPQPTGTVVLAADFEAEAVDWVFSGGAAVAPDGDANHTLNIPAGGGLAPAVTPYLADQQIDARFNLASADAELTLNFRTGETGAYQLALNAAGATVYRLGGEVPNSLATFGAEYAAGTWYALSVRATGADLLVSVDGTPILAAREDAPLTGGAFAFAVTTGAALLDDVVVTDLTAADVIDATATPAAYALSPDASARLGGALAGILELYAGGDEAGALELARAAGYQFDPENRVTVTLLAAENVTGAQLAELVTMLGGEVLLTNPYSVDARLSFSALIAASSTSEVYLIQAPLVATSTSNDAAGDQQVGTAVSEGFDLVGANGWVNGTPQVRGANSVVAVLDTSGFAGAVANSGETTCYKGLGGNGTGYVNAAGTGNHGTNVLQVICDLAPASSVYSYLVTPANIAAAVDAIRLDTTRNFDLILLALDLGANFSPGNGAGVAGEPQSSGLYSALAAARAANILIVASAGNNGYYIDDPFTNVDDGWDRYVTMTSTGNSTIPLVNIPRGVAFGLNFSYDLWGASGGPTIQVSGGGLIAQQVVGAGRPATSPAGSQINFTAAQNTCTDAQDPSDWDGDANLAEADGFCDAITVTISGAAGRTLQIQVTGGSATLASFGGFYAYGVLDSALITSGTALTTTGNLARPADSPDVFTVGAVCAAPSEETRPILDESSRGPIFNAAGTGPETTIAPMDYKPNVVAPSIVTTSLSASTNDCFLSAPGFRGTSAAAAHVAGMAALVLSNPALNDAGQPDNRTIRGYAPNGTLVDQVEAYLMSHTTDLPFDAPGGFDATYGMGLASLGNPAPTYTLVDSTTNAVVPGGCGSSVYVNPGRIFTLADTTPTGTPADPFVHIGQAIQSAGSGNCVVLMPGEYVSPIVYAFSAPDVGVFSYASAVQSSVNPSAFYANVTYGGAMIYTRQNDTVVDGMTYTAAPIRALSSYPRPRGFNIGEVSASSIRNNIFDGFVRPSLVDNIASAVIQGNTFRNATAAGTAAAAIHVNSGAATGNIFFNPFTTVLVQYNTFENLIGGGATSTNWEAIVYAENAQMSFYNNTFQNNTAETLVRIQNSARNIQSGTVSHPQFYIQRFIGNVFANNQVEVVPGAGLGNTSGPMISLESSLRLRFVNNTLVDNVIASQRIANQEAGSLIGFGAATEISAGVVGNLGSRNLNYAGDSVNVAGNYYGLVDVHNNLIYYSTFSRTNINAAVVDQVPGGLITDPSRAMDYGGGNGPQTPICDSTYNGQTADTNGAQNNWIYPDINPDLSHGLCGAQTEYVNDGDPQIIYNNNLVDEVAFPINDAIFFGTFDPQHPYRLRPLVAPDINPGLDSAQCDANGTGTPADAPICGGNGTLLTNATSGGPALTTDRRSYAPRVTGTLDIGAYELEPPTPIDINSFNVTATETDSVVVVTINFAQVGRVTGGYPLYNITVIDPPDNYDTDPNNACKGQPLYIDPVTRNGLYCAPANFWNWTGSAFVLPEAATTFTYTASDALGNPANEAPATVQIRVSPENDGVPSPGFGTQTFTVDYATPLNIPLPPSVAFNNFSPPAQTNWLDYPFTFSLSGSVTSDNNGLFGAGSPDTIVSTELATIDNDGVFSLTPVLGQTGTWTFDYNIADRDGESPAGSEGTITIVVRPRVAGVGLHDDASLNFRYASLNDEILWTPLYQVGAINNTLHQIAVPAPQLIPDPNIAQTVPVQGQLNGSTNPASAEFRFTGDTFILNYYTNGATGNMQLQVDVDGDNPTTGTYDFAPLATTVDGSTLTCTHSNTATTSPLVLGATANASQFYVGNGVFTTARAAGYYQITCTGFDSGANVGRPHGLLIRNVDPTRRPIMIDAVEVRSGVLSPGTYEESFVEFDLLPTASAWTNTVNALTSRGSYYTSVTNNARIEFEVDGNLVDGLVVNRFTCLTCADLRVSVDLAGGAVDFVTRATLPGYSVATVLTPGIVDSLNLPAGTHTIRIERVTAAGKSAQIDTITLLGQRGTLTLTGGISGGPSYEENTPEIIQIGRWTQLARAQNTTGNGTEANSTDVNSALRFRLIGYGLTVDRAIGTGLGAANICLYNNDTYTAAALIGCRATPLIAGVVSVAPFTYRVPNTGTYWVEIKPLTAAAVGISGITVLDAPQPLAAGSTVYDNTNPDVLFSGTWATLPIAGTIQGTVNQANVINANNKVSVRIGDSDSPTGQQGIVIYRTTCPTCADLRVINTQTGQTLATVPGYSAATLYSQAYIVANHTAANDDGDSLADLIEIVYAPGTPATRPLIQIDAIQVVNGLTLTGSVNTNATYEEDDPKLTYFGTWTPAATPTNGYTTISAVPTPAIRFVIQGGGITLHRFVGGTYGTFNVCIDNVCRLSPVVTGTAQSQAWTYRAPTNGVHTVEIRFNGPGLSGFDKVVVLDQFPSLQPENLMYQETAPEIAFVAPAGSTTFPWITQASTLYSGGSQAYTTTPGAAVRFVLDGGESNSFIVYRYACPTCGPIEARWVIYSGTQPSNPNFNGSAQANIPVTPTIGYAVPYVVNNVGITNGQYALVELRLPLSPAGRIFGFDGVQAEYETSPSLGAGIYEVETIQPATPGVGSTSTNLKVFGQWYQDGTNGTLYTTEVNSLIRFEMNNTLRGVTVYRNNGTGMANFQVCFYSNPEFTTYIPNTTAPTTDDAATACRTFVNSGLGILPSTFRPTIAGNPPNVYVEIRNLSANLRLAIDKIELTAGLPLLQNGIIYQENATQLETGTGWIPQANGFASGALQNYTATIGAFVDFTIDADSTEQLAIYYSTCATCGSLQLLQDGADAGTVPDDALVAGSTFSTYTATPLYGQIRLIDVTALTGTVTLRLRASNNPGPVMTPITQDSGRNTVYFDAIQPLDSATYNAAIGAGTYQAESAPAQFTFMGNWAVDPRTASPTDDVRYSTDSTGRIRFNMGTNRSVSVVRQNVAGHGNFQICIYDNNAYTVNAATLCRTSFLNGTVDSTFTLFTERTSGTNFVEIRNLSTLRVGIDSITINANPPYLANGVTVQNTDANLLLMNPNPTANPWVTAVSAVYTGGSAAYTTTGAVTTPSVLPAPGARFAVEYNSGTRGFAVLRQTCSTCGAIEVWYSVNGSAMAQAPAPLSSTSVAILYNQPFVVDLTASPYNLGPGETAVIELRHTAAAGPLMYIDGVQALTVEDVPTAAPLNNSTTYQAESLGVGATAAMQFYGNWASETIGADTVAYAADQNAAIRFVVSDVTPGRTPGVVINRLNGLSQGSFTVCFYADSSYTSLVGGTTTTGCRTSTNTGTAPTSLKFWMNNPGTYYVEIRTLSTLRVNIDSIEILNSPPALLPPTASNTRYYQESADDFFYNGTWAVAPNGLASGAAQRSTTVASAYMRFYVRFDDGVTDLAIYRQICSTCSNMRLDWILTGPGATNGSSADILNSNGTVLAYNQPHYVDIALLTGAWGAGNVLEVRITHVATPGKPTLFIDGVQALSATQLIPVGAVTFDMPAAPGTIPTNPTFMGNWAFESFSGTSVAYTTDAAAAIRFVTTSRQVAVNRLNGVSQGNFEICIYDNEPLPYNRADPDTVCRTSLNTGTAPTTVRAWQGLTPNEVNPQPDPNYYYVEVRNLSALRINIDSIQTIANPPTLPVGTTTQENSGDVHQLGPVGAWLNQPNGLASGAAQIYTTNNTTASYVFSLTYDTAAGARGFALLRQTCATCAAMDFRFSVNGGAWQSPAALQDVSNNTTATLYAQPYTVDLNGAGIGVVNGDNVVVEVRKDNAAIATATLFIDGILPLTNSAFSSLVTGTYNLALNTAGFQFIGNWQQDATYVFTTDATAAIRFRTTELGAQITRGNGVSQGTFDVCLYDNPEYTTNANTLCRRSVNLGTVNSALMMLGTAETGGKFFEIRNISAARINIDTIQIFDSGTAGALRVATSDVGTESESSARVMQASNLVTAGWVAQPSTLYASGGQSSTSNITARMRFMINAAAGDDLVIVRPTANVLNYNPINYRVYDMTGNVDYSGTLVSNVAPFGNAQPSNSVQAGSNQIEIGAAGTYVVELYTSSATTPIYVDGVQLVGTYPATIPVDATVQETDPRLLFVGAWADDAGTRYTTELPGMIRFGVNNGGAVTGVVVNRTNGVGQGSFQVCYYTDATFTTFVPNATVTPLDDAATACATSTVQPGNAVTSFMFRHTVAPLPVGTFFVQIKNLAATRFGIDSINVIDTVPALTAGVMYQENSTLLVNSGFIASPNGLASGGAQYTSTLGTATLQFTIDGATMDRLIVYRQVCPTCANIVVRAHVYTTATGPGTITLNQIDADPVAGGVNAIPGVNGTLTQYAQPWFIDVSGLVSGTQSAIVQLSLELPMAGRTSGFIDGVQVVNGVGFTPLAAGTYPETQAELLYLGAWNDESGTRYTTEGGLLRFAIAANTQGISLVRKVGSTPLYGTLEICFYSDAAFTTLVTGVPCRQYVNIAGTVQSQEISFWLPSLPTPITYVQIRNVTAAQRTAIDSITVHSSFSTALNTTARRMQPNLELAEGDATFNYPPSGSGSWNSIANANALGGAYRQFSGTPVESAGARIAFTVPDGQIVNSLVIYRTTCATCANQMQVWDTSVTPNRLLGQVSNYSATTLYAQPALINIVPLMPAGARNLEIRYVTAGAQVTPTFDGMIFRHLYEENSEYIAFAGAWTNVPSAAYFNNAAFTTTTTDNKLAFVFEGTGFVLFTQRLPTGAPIEVCQRRLDVAATGCTPLTGVPTEYRTTNSAATQYRYGLAYYGLDQGTYLIEITHEGPTVAPLQSLYVDAVAIFAEAPATVLPRNVRTDNTSPNIVYGAGPSWTYTTNNALYAGGTQQSTVIAGATVQFTANTNTVTIYQQLPGASNNVRFCVVRDDPRDPVAQPASSEGLMDCGNYSQAGGSGYVMPVVLYGFGAGNYTVVLENRAPLNFTIDAILPN